MPGSTHCYTATVFLRTIDEYAILRCTLNVCSFLQSRDATHPRKAGVSHNTRVGRRFKSWPRVNGPCDQDLERVREIGTSRGLVVTLVSSSCLYRMCPSSHYQVENAMICLTRAKVDGG